MKRIEIWQESHMTYYISENIAKYAAKYESAKRAIHSMSRSEYRRLLASLEETASPTGYSIGRADATSLSRMAALCTLLETIGSRGSVHAESSEAIVKAAECSRKIAEAHLTGTTDINVPSPSLPEVHLLLNEEEVVHRILPRLAEYDNLTLKMFALSKRKDQTEFRDLLDEVRKKTGGRLIRPAGNNQTDMVLFLEKISILKLLTEESSDRIKIRPESMEALTSANRRLNEASFMTYAGDAGRARRSELKEVVSAALAEHKREKTMSKLS